MRTITLRKGCEGRVRSGHLWIFSNEILDFDRTIPAGEDVAVLDSRRNLLGSGTFSPSSLIAVRLHARGEERPLDADLLRERICRAWECRKLWLKDEATACRAVYAEADGVPGLIVDRFGEYLSVQCLTAGIDCRSESVVGALDEVHRPKGIVLRNDSPAREAEGLDRVVTLGCGEVPATVAFHLHGLTLEADPGRAKRRGSSSTSARTTAY